MRSAHMLSSEAGDALQPSGGFVDNSFRSADLRAT